MNRRNVVGVALGRKGSGKSTLARRMVAAAPRVIVLDWLAEYDHTTAGAEVVTGLDAALDALRSRVDDSTVRLSIRVDTLDDALSVLRVVAHWHDALIVVEETSRYCSPFHLPTEIETLIRYGRHSNLDQLYVARRPAEIHRDLTSNADFVATFRQWEPRDVQYLRSLVGVHGEIEIGRAHV